jgi:hypothetical protein
MKQGIVIFEQFRVTRFENGNHTVYLLDGKIPWYRLRLKILEKGMKMGWVMCFRKLCQAINTQARFGGEFF